MNIRFLLAVPLILLVAVAPASAKPIDESDATDVSYVRLVAVQPQPVSLPKAAGKERVPDQRVSTVVRVRDRRSNRVWNLRRSSMVYRDTGWSFDVRLGRRILGVSANDSGVAWIEEQITKQRGRRVTVWTQRLLPRAGAPQRVDSRVLGVPPYEFDQPPYADGEDVALTNDGTVAWASQARRGEDKSYGSDGVRILRPGRRVPVWISGAIELDVLDGRTIVWLSFGADDLAFRDFGPPPGKDPCPALSPRRVAENSGYVVTRVSYDPDPGGNSSQGIDPLFLRLLCSKATGAMVRVNNFALTDGGRAAWLLSGGTLRASPPSGSGTSIVLDKGPITSLAHDGERFTWTNNGVARSEAP